MTDRPQTAAASPLPTARPHDLTGREPRQDARRPGRARHSHPLLSPFPLVVMTLATFLVLFTLMTARLHAGADPALRAGTSTSAPAAGSATGAVTTRTSGGHVSAASAAPAAGPEGSPARTPAVVTRTSGGGGTVGVGDE